MTGDAQEILLNSEAFPATFRDVDLGIYFIECKIPDASMKMENVQIIMDNNVLGIATDHPDAFVHKIGWYFSNRPNASISLNPGVAATEQYLSNSWDNAKTHLENFELAVSKFSMFKNGQLLETLRSVARNEADTRQQIGILYCYLAILRHLYFYGPKGSRLEAWSNFYHQDIPRIQVPYFFGALFLLSKDKPQLRFMRQEAKVEKYADGFLMLRKKEKGDFTRWLRNRAFDIIPFIMAPTLSFERFGGYSSRTVIATNDEVVGECIGRLFAWAGDQQHGDRWHLAATLPNVIDQHDNDIKLAIEHIYRGAAPHRPSSPEERKARLRNLIQISMDMVSADDRTPLHEALGEYRIYDMVV
ncbi:hypothetical protein GALL_174240 [mine drainage metagenome]|uniref:Uncharacterized protein n=1 Tax=mine drainage metagenome TaxID=410659 RepID=A0A1J5RX98_9ZZZZ